MQRVLSVFACFCLLLQARLYAGTIAWWRFEDGVPGNQAATVTSLFNSPTMDGVAKANSGSKHIYSTEVPNIAIEGGPGNIGGSNSLSLFGTVNGNNRIEVDDNVNTPPLHEPHEFTFEMFFRSDLSQPRNVFRALAKKTRGFGTGSWYLFLTSEATGGRIAVRADFNLTPGGLGFNQGCGVAPLTTADGTTSR